MDLWTIHAAVPGPLCRYITNDQLGISEETVFLRLESPYLLVHLMPSGGCSDNQVTPHSSPTRGHWPQWPILIFEYNFVRIICISRDFLFEADFYEI